MNVNVVQIGPLSVALYEREIGNKDTGGKVWENAIVLSNYIESMERRTPGFWTNKNVIELGCGTGLSGIIAYLLGANVILTDVASILDLTTQNVEAAKLLRREGCGTIKVMELPWGSPLPSELRSIAFNYVIASDVVYTAESFSPLVRTLRDLTEVYERPPDIL